MNCEECKGLISSFLDSELETATAAAVRSHLAECGGCAAVCEDFASILDVCSIDPPPDVVPPNPQAMWCRINNILESESKPVPNTPPVPRRRLWQLSFGQVAAAVLCIAIVSSLLTVVAIRNYMNPSADIVVDSASTEPTMVERFLGRVGLVETPQQARARRQSEKQAAIDYWNARVQSRRAQWDRATREAFDRNLNVIDESVYEYTMILQRDPEDELSGEMLDTVLTDKMNLLRDFSDL